ncbi:MAG: flippase-like domain-containing protein [Trueperaceae bacterium]|nr:flippase-like domain-containing protein [Trueperaceae bacterium]
MKTRLHRVIPWLSLLLSLASLAAIFFFTKTRTIRLSSIHLPYAMVAIGLMVLTYLLGGLRLQIMAHYLQEKVALGSAVKAHILGLFSAALTPSGSGHAPMIALSLQSSGLSASQAWSVSLYSNIVDMLCYAWMLILALFYLLIDHANLDKRILWGAGFASLLLVGLFYFFSFHIHYLNKLAHLIFTQRFLKRWHRPVMRFSSKLMANLSQLGQIRFSQQVILQAVSSAMHFAGFSIFYVCLRAVGLEPAYLSTVAIIFLVLLLGFVVPTPGASGYVETASVFIVKGQYDISLVLTAVLLWRLISHYSSFILGPLLGGYNLRRELKHARP